MTDDEKRSKTRQPKEPVEPRRIPDADEASRDDLRPDQAGVRREGDTDQRGNPRERNEE